MKKQNVRYWFASALSLFAFQTIGFSQIQNPDSATVTFRVNTAFVQDTLTSGSSVSIRGTAFGGDWSLEKGIKLKNADGDYWEAEKKVPVGSSGGPFKMVTLTGTGTGWDRHQVDPFEIKNDTTLELFATGLKETYTDPVTGTEITRDDNWNPLELAKNGETSVYAVHFRVNMQGVEAFKASKHVVTVRGSFNSWSAADTLKAEVRHDDLTSGFGPYEADQFFFSKTILIPKTYVGEIKYKFVVSMGEDVSWESISDRSFMFSGDTTLNWKWFDNKQPVYCDCEILFPLTLNVDMEKAIQSNGFNPQTDTLVAVAGSLGSAAKIVEFELHPTSGTIYTGSDSILSAFNRTVFYRFFKKSQSNQIVETYFDFYNDQLQPSAPIFRKIVMPSSGESVTGWDIDKTVESTHRQPFFKNLNKISDSTILVIEADLRPAHFFTKELGDTLVDLLGGSLKVTASNIDTLGLYIRGTQIWWDCWCPWWDYPPELFDNGLYGDQVAGDNIYTIKFIYSPNSPSAQEFVFMIGSGNNESKLFYHVVNLIDREENKIRVQFGETDPLRYRNDKGFWDFNAGKGVMTSINESPYNEVPGKMTISAYPNPFNPATLISYSIPQSGKVSLKVFDLLGRQVGILTEEIKPAGTHLIPFRGDDLASGIYLVRMESGNKTESVKVILLK
ncbi:MAG: T9SS type A sorting domain-containing protein [Bacteroidetes bacterium]|nr:T9SS type A sorting domain-containing protein [Bacteroidota bacterium]